MNAAGARLLAADLDGDGRQSLGLRPRRHRVLVELDHLDTDSEAPVHGIGQRFERFANPWEGGDE